MKTRIEHGGNLRDFAMRFHLNENEILDYSSNINPLNIPDSVRRVYLESARELTRYPDPTSRELCQEISKIFSVPGDLVIAGNGSMSLLNLAVRTLAPKRALILEPSFSEYRSLLEGQGAQVQSLYLKEDNDFRFMLPEIVQALRRNDLLMIGHPNNPTGTAFQRAELLELLATANRHGVFVILDEAFADWVPEISVIDEVRENSNFLVVRSLTKFYALAGLRSGFAIGPSNLIERMKGDQELWSMNRLAEKLSIVALRDKAFQKKTLDWFKQESSSFRKALESLGTFKVYPGLANFILLRLHHHDVPSLFEALGKKGIYIRSAANFNGLDDSFLRIAIRLKEENQTLIESFRQCLPSSAPSFSTS
jgi:threonine-phosphate decarboxylase